MEIKALSLENFRNFEKGEFEFGQGSALILGPNTSGKTSILEAVRLLSTGDSFRAERVSEMIRFGSEIARIKNENLEVVLTKGEIQGKKTPKRKFLVNGVEKKKRDFVGHLLTVIFRPEDIRVITGSPTRRREFFNLVLSQTNWEYRRALSAYQRALRQRNKILEGMREGKAKKSDLFFWNQSLSKNGEVINKSREEFVSFVNRFWPEGLRFFYRRSRFVPDKNLEKEIARGITSTGPHRDDFWVKKNEKNLALFGSRSEQRLAVLDLKLAELEFIREEMKEKPVLLLDDIFSELDKDFRQKIFQIILGQQTIVTTAEPRLIKKEFLDKMKKIEL